MIDSRYLDLRLLLLCITLCLLSLLGKGQELHFVQAMSMPTSLNPALAGTNYEPLATLGVRTGNPSNSTGLYGANFSFDQRFKSVGSMGLLLANRITENALGAVDEPSIQDQLALVSFSRELPVSRVTRIQLAVEMGFLRRAIDERLAVPEQQSARAAFDLGFGFVKVVKKGHFGIGARHLTRPNMSLLEGTEERLPIQWTLHGNRMFYLTSKCRLEALGQLQKQGSAARWNLGALVGNYVIQAGGFWQDHSGLAAVVGWSIIPAITLRYAYQYQGTDAVGKVEGIHHEIAFTYRKARRIHRRWYPYRIRSLAY